MKNKTYIENSEEKITDEAAKKSNAKLLPKGTLLFSFKLTVGKVAIATKDLYTNEAIAGIIPKDNKLLTTKYLYYLLPTLNYRTQSAAKGKTLNKKNIENIIVPHLPSITVQKKIVKQLDEKEDEKQKLLMKIANISREQKKMIEALIKINNNK
jgi:restriction endonuclease S subunit